MLHALDVEPNQAAESVCGAVMLASLGTDMQNRAPVGRQN